MRPTHRLDQAAVLLRDPSANRGTAFTHEERSRLGLTGRLPAAVETLDEQAARAWEQLGRKSTPMAKYIYLDQLHERNEVLYFKLLIDHLKELLPIVYDPTIGQAIKERSSEVASVRWTPVNCGFTQPGPAAQARAEPLQRDHVHTQQG